MVIFRNLILQRILCLIFVCTASLAHTQILFACELMHDKPKLVCCCGEAMHAACPMSDTCGMQENTNQTPCCEVSHDSLVDVVMSPSASAADILTLLLDGSQPPPLIAYREFSVYPHPRLIHVIPPPEPLLFAGDGPTYLRTLRIRL